MAAFHLFLKNTKLQHLILNVLSWWAALLSHLCQFCKGLRITPVTPLQAVHGTLGEGSGASKLARMPLSCTPLGHAHQSRTNTLQLDRMGLYPKAKISLIRTGRIAGIWESLCMLHIDQPVDSDMLLSLMSLLPGTPRLSELDFFLSLLHHFQSGWALKWASLTWDQEKGRVCI